MTTERSMEAKLRRALIPVAPRKAYARILKAKLLSGPRMPVELEKADRVGEIVTLTTLGLGAVATVAAVATIGGKVAGLLGSGILLLGAAKQGMGPNKANSQSAC
ncbi:MAG: hypothetical protein JW929_03180 [Anaerolineales bacterium]|nr:hypothetical protein [Anaerolineales bacterium]